MEGSAILYLEKLQPIQISIETFRSHQKLYEIFQNLQIYKLCSLYQSNFSLHATFSSTNIYSFAVIQVDFRRAFILLAL